jgi:hypothetical protein
LPPPDAAFMIKTGLPDTGAGADHDRGGRQCDPEQPVRQRARAVPSRPLRSDRSASAPIASRSICHRCRHSEQTRHDVILFSQATGQLESLVCPSRSALSRWKGHLTRRRDTTVYQLTDCT